MIKTGQYWKHDSGKDGLTVWEIMSTFLSPSFTPMCEMMLIVSGVDRIHISKSNAMKIGEVRDYPQNLFEQSVSGELPPGLSYWSLIEEEDIPLLLLAELP